MDREHPFYVLIETSGSNKEHDDEKLMTYLENIMSRGVAQDGVVAQDETQIRRLWAIRDGLTEALGKEPAVYKYDISMPVSRIWECAEDMRQHLRDGGVFGDPESPVTDVVAYGHLGDGNLHLNIAAKRLDMRVSDLIEPYLFEWVCKCHALPIHRYSPLTTLFSQTSGIHQCRAWVRGGQERVSGLFKITSYDTVDEDHEDHARP